MEIFYSDWPHALLTIPARGSAGPLSIRLSTDELLVCVCRLIC
jgi:hypothetical protein